MPHEIRPPRPPGTQHLTNGIMKILVCTTQSVPFGIPATESEPSRADRFQPSSGRAMNPYDEYALEEALRLKDRFPGVRVDVASLGTDRIMPILKRAMGMGADQATLIQTGETEPRDAWFIADRIGTHILSGSYDLVMTGIMSEDTARGHVGPMLAERLRLPCVAAVVLVDYFPEQHLVHVEREAEHGLRERFEIPLPAVLTIQTGTHKPRYPSLSNMVRASRQGIEIVDSGPAQDYENREIVVGVHTPKIQRTCLVLQGTTAEKAIALIDLLRDRALLQRIGNP